MSEKSSLDYAELAGLRLALSNLMNSKPVTTDTELSVKIWMMARIKELESK